MASSNSSDFNDRRGGSCTPVTSANKFQRSLHLNGLSNGNDPYALERISFQRTPPSSESGQQPTVEVVSQTQYFQPSGLSRMSFSGKYEGLGRWAISPAEEGPVNERLYSIANVGVPSKKR
ncbi:MAG: hypothetical protein MMC33_004677 [Icmadophila ericetorum]|nr:hypothetical protein [Icmadophila ericetorum]